VKVFVLFEGYGGGPAQVLGVFANKKRLCGIMAKEFPSAKPRNRKSPSELYWEEDDGAWFRAEQVVFFSGGTE
jgi:hypothetical protein